MGSVKYQKYNPNSVNIPIPLYPFERHTIFKTTLGGCHFNNRDRFSKTFTQYKEGKHFEPSAIKTYPGWALVGGNKRLNTSVNSNLTQTFNVERFWETENYETVPKHDDCIMTKDEKRAINILQNTISFKEGKYKTELLRRRDRVNLPSNRQLAIQRLQSLEKVLARNDDLKTKYHKTVKNNT